MKELLHVKDISKTFTLSAKQRKIERTNDRKKTAVNHLSFSAYEGEIFGLLGSNGAGKTTTLRIIATLIAPDSGDVLIDGISVRQKPDEIRKRIGFLTSELKLEEFFTPNYLFDFFSQLHGIEPAVAEKRKQNLFDKFGISKFAEVKVANLSTGMKQKISLVISVVHNPDIIIFDEPTNGLDVLTAKVVTDFLLELKSIGKTVLLSTHIFSLVEKVCDRVGIVIDGKMIACDTIKSITADMSLEDKFFQLYQETEGGPADA